MEKTDVQNALDLLGFKAEDKITGATGVIDSISFDLYGCIQCVLRPPLNKENPEKTPEPNWFDINRLKVIDKEPVMPGPKFQHIPGPKFQHIPGGPKFEHIPGPANKPNK